jgi:hypothetical protein
VEHSGGNETTRNTSPLLECKILVYFLNKTFIVRFFTFIIQPFFNKLKVKLCFIYLLQKGRVQLYSFFLFFNTQVAKRSVLAEEKLESFLDNSEVIMHE